MQSAAGHMVDRCCAVSYSLGSVTSVDGTVIGYRQLGEGPGLVLVHGGGQAAQNLMRLAELLSDEFTVYVPDRRGRGMSGPLGADYGLAAEVQDLTALLRETGSERVFGLSSGALVCLDAALSYPLVFRLALYEPPLSVDHSTPVDWVDRFDREIADGKIGSAMITATRGTETAPALVRWTPRFILAPLLDRAARGGPATDEGEGPGSGQGSQGRRPVLRLLLWPIRRVAAGRNPPDSGPDAADVPLRDLVATMHYDAQLVGESEGRLINYREITIPVLLLGGSRSPDYLHQALDALEVTLPSVRRVELAGAGHLAPDNTGEPDRVADELRRFFGADPQP